MHRIAPQLPVSRHVGLLTLLTSAALLSLVACSSVPPANPKLDEARQAYQDAQSDPSVQTRAPVELKQAGDALALANDASVRGDAPKDVDHLAYLAKQRVAIAQATAGQKKDEATVAGADAMRDKVRLAARTDEADSAHRVAGETQARNDVLEAQIKGLKAKKTDRGLVMTMGDVLFDTDKARIKSGGLQSMDRLADFLKAYPQRTALVEGFTDNVGSQAHNLALSNQRASAVRSALVDRGVSLSRINVQGYGEANPAAGNDSAAGRQLNRRVEIVLSDETGHISSR